MTRMQMSAMRTAIAAAVALLLSGCTSTGSGVITESINSSTSEPTVVSTSETSTVSAISPDIVSFTPAEPSTTTSSSAAAPWPADFTPDQQQVAQVALEVVAGFINVLKQADAAPSAKDWTADIRKFAGDPAATITLNGINSLAAAGVHVTVPSTYENVKVISGDDHRVIAEACVDSTNTVGVNAADESILKPSTNPRSIAVYTLGLFAPADGGWLVIETAAADPVRPC